jgi:DDE superfamily endonuclease
MTMMLTLTVSAALTLLFLLSTVAAVEEDGGFATEDPYRLMSMLVSVVLASFPAEFGEGGPPRRPSVSPIKRKRRSVKDIFRELGPTYSRRAYRMDEESFFRLHKILQRHLKSPASPKKKWRNGSPNGLITTCARLSMAIRYFAGGRPEDISLVHGVSHSEVFRSVWKVVDAVLKCKELAYSFPSDHEKQRVLAAGFEAKSQVGFKGCCGAIDGMLIWTERFSDEECARAGVASKRFFCGRKHKFGLNMQGTCDSECRFLDVSIKHAASTSDFLAFTTSSLYRQLEQPDFLAPGLSLFGDLAYVNCRYFTTPFKSVSSGPKDHFNYYHSQLRIRIECAFGQLVSRWGILRRAMPTNVGIKKTVSLVFCLCRLHNYCINERIMKAAKQRVSQGAQEAVVPRALASDNLEVMRHGGIATGRDGQVSADDLIGAGHHFIDTTKSYRRQVLRREKSAEGVPRDKLLEIITRGGFMRPTPKKWQK